MNKIFLSLIFLFSIIGIGFATNINKEFAYGDIDLIDEWLLVEGTRDLSFAQAVVLDEETLFDQVVLYYKTEDFASNQTYKIKFYRIETWEYGTNYPGELINMSTPVLVHTINNVQPSMQDLTFHISNAESQEEYLFKAVLERTLGNFTAIADTDFLVVPRQEDIIVESYLDMD